MTSWGDTDMPDVPDHAGREVAPGARMPAQPAGKASPAAEYSELETIRPEELASRPTGTIPAAGSSSHGHTTPPIDSTPGGAPRGTGAPSTPTPGETSDEWDQSPPPNIAEGEIVFEKYRLERKIGVGGMGEVWLVHNIELDRPSALKLIKPGIARNDQGWRRFRREAQLMAKLEHPNAVGVYDFRRIRSMGYIEMEFVRGRSLDKVLKDRDDQPQPLGWIVPILDQLCAVLQQAHGHVDERTGKARPIIHRDLKPSNLMLVDRKPPGHDLKVLDFGIAKIAEDDGSPELTGVGDLLGTPAYMSPEQIRGGITAEGRGEIDGRSDLYSVGVMLYQFLTGKLPFGGTNKMAMLAAHMETPPPPMKRANPAVDVPPQVEALVLRCLEKDPDRRPRSAAVLAEQFRAVAGYGADRPLPGARRARGPAVVAAGLLAAGLVATGAWFTFRTSGPITTASGGDGKDKEVPPIKDDTKEELRDPKRAGKSSSNPRTWLPDGFEVAEPLEPAPDAPDETMMILRTADRQPFRRINKGAYIPVKYEPESASLSDLVEGVWPRIIVRSSDKVRFIRIPGKMFQQGDTRTAPEALIPHWVRLRGFYIQETEVTNGEIEAYREAWLNADEDLRDWADYYQKLKSRTRPEQKARRFPAVLISYAAARRYAVRMGGRLPTEAEWEFAARSCSDDAWFPWGTTVPRPPKKKANVYLDRFSPPAPVGEFPEDRTDQGVLDMAGNVRELCLDAYKPYAQFVPADNSTDNPLDNPSFPVEPRPETPTRYVVKGGCFRQGIDRAMAFQRDGVPAESPSDDLGFRIVLDCPPAR